MFDILVMFCFMGRAVWLAVYRREDLCISTTSVTLPLSSWKLFFLLLQHSLWSIEKPHGARIGSAVLQTHCCWKQHVK